MHPVNDDWLSRASFLLASLTEQLGLLLVGALTRAERPSRSANAPSADCNGLNVCVQRTVVDSDHEVAVPTRSFVGDERADARVEAAADDTRAAGAFSLR
jgi:hypothetical protein